jgi:hypothetical protein
MGLASLLFNCRELALLLVWRLNKPRVGLENGLPTVNLSKLSNLQARYGRVTEPCLILVVDISESTEG